MRSSNFLALFVSAGLSLSAAAEERPRCVEAFPAERAECVKPWTILIYMRGAPDLNVHALADLYEMEAGYETDRASAGSSTRQSDWVAEVDLDPQAPRRRFLIQQSSVPYQEPGSSEYFSTLSIDQLRSPYVQLTSDHPTVESERLQDFLRWGIRNYPAEHYALILWGHGRGWADQSLTSLRLREVLKNTRDEDLGGNPIDLVTWDACWMQSLEVATELVGVANYVVGSSEQFDPVGLPYRRLAYQMNRAPLLTPLNPDELARKIPELMRASLTPGGLQRPYATRGIETLLMNSISLHELDSQLLPALALVAQTLKDQLRADEDFAADLEDWLEREPRMAGNQLDLGVFLSQLESMLNAPTQSPFDRFPVLDALHRARAALDRTVLSRVFGTRYSEHEANLYLKGFRGLSFWLTPSTEEFRKRLPEYRTSTFYQWLPGWETWQTLVHPF